MDQENSNKNKYEFIRGIEDIHDHRFRDAMTSVKDLLRRCVSLTESSARMELSKDLEVKDIQECLGIMKDIQYRAKRYAGELFVLRNHLQGVDENGDGPGRKKRGSGTGAWKSNPNSIASKSGFSPE